MGTEETEGEYGEKMSAPQRPLGLLAAVTLSMVQRLFLSSMLSECGQLGWPGRTLQAFQEGRETCWVLNVL